MTISQYPIPNTRHLTGQSGLWLTAFLAVLLLLCPQPAHALTFSFTDGAGMKSLKTANPTLYTQIHAGMKASGEYIGARISTPVTVTVLVDYRSQSGIASTSAPVVNLSYNDYRLRLLKTRDALSKTDVAVAAALPLNNPTYACRNAGVTVYPSVLAVPQALAKALGKPTPPTVADGAITISSKYKYDFTREDGITTGQYDFVGIAAHELLHVLGWSSVVDGIDSKPSGGHYPRPMDLFRYSLNTIGVPVRDASADRSSQFFSLDGKPTDLMLCTGVKLGNRQNAGHWAGASGMMIPQTATGKRLEASANDLAVLDAIGWTLTR